MMEGIGTRMGCVDCLFCVRRKLVWSVQMLVLVYARCSVPLLRSAHCQPFVLTGTCALCAPGRLAERSRLATTRRGRVGHMSEI
jgi:hypothetical protein